MSSTEPRRPRAGRARCRVAALSTALVLLAVIGTGCSVRRDMYDQPRLKPLAANAFFADGRASRDFPKGTVARGYLKEDGFFYRGVEDTALATHFPMPVTREVLLRGQQRFNIYCTPCHDGTGSGRGMVVQRGFKQPPSYHVDRLRRAPPGYLFDVATNGYGVMQGYAAQIPTADRWAIVAYIRALQLSQNAKLDSLPADDRARAEAGLQQAAAKLAEGDAAHEAHGESGGH